MRFCFFFFFTIKVHFCLHTRCGHWHRGPGLWASSGQPAGSSSRSLYYRAGERQGDVLSSGCGTRALATVHWRPAAPQTGRKGNDRIDFIWNLYQSNQYLDHVGLSWQKNSHLTHFHHFYRSQIITTWPFWKAGVWKTSLLFSCLTKSLWFPCSIR